MEEKKKGLCMNLGAGAGGEWVAEKSSLEEKFSWEI